MSRITEPVTTEHVVAIVCDRCRTRIARGTPGFNAVTRIDHNCGYGSAWEDGSREPTIKSHLLSYSAAQAAFAA